MENLISKKYKYSYVIDDSFKIGFRGTETNVGEFCYLDTLITVQDFDYECYDCENTGLLDPYGVYGLGDDDCPKCSIEIAHAYYYSDVPLFNIKYTRECVILAIFKAHKIFYKDILDAQSQ